MKNLLIFTISVFLSLMVGAQTKYEDSLRLESTIDWLEDKLTYNYYNENDDEWWINRFTFNKGSESVTIKNIASPHLEAVTDKTYLQLNFRLQELNPYTIQIAENENNAGRLVKGKTIRIGAYNKSIKRVKNGRLSNNQSFLYLSIPHFFEDSLQNYTETIGLRLEEAIRLSTRIYNQSHQQNMASIQSMLAGKFTEPSGNTWIIDEIFNKTFEVSVVSASDDLLAKHFVQLGDELIVNSITGEGMSQFALSTSDAPEMTYTSKELTILFRNTNEFIWTIGSTPVILVRDWREEYLEAKYR